MYARVFQGLHRSDELVRGSISMPSIRVIHWLLVSVSELHKSIRLPKTGYCVHPLLGSRGKLFLGSRIARHLSTSFRRTVERR